MPQLKVPATYMRGGTSKGVFFLKGDLPADPGERDRLLLRVVGSPDPYGQQIDGMGGATSSTSKVVLISKSTRPGHDVDYLFGQVAIDRPVIDWSGNCGNLTSAVGPFAITAGLVEAPPRGHATVRIWQANIQKTIIAHVPMQDGEVQEEGDFSLDGVTFPAAEVKIEFIDPAAEGNDATSGDTGGAMFPTGSIIEVLDVPAVGPVEVTLINAGIPTIFIDADALGLKGTELQADVNGNAGLLARVEAIRAHCAFVMGLVSSAAEASRTLLHTPKLAFVAPPAGYVSSDGKPIDRSSIDVLVRMFSMGKLHHAMPGTGAVAIAVATAVPGTVVHRATARTQDGTVRFGHPSGTLAVGAEVRMEGSDVRVGKVRMSRSARRLMEGWVRVPGR